MLDYYLHVFGRKCPKRAGKKIPKFPKEDTYITKDMYYTSIARLNWQNSSNSRYLSKQKNKKHRQNFQTEKGEKNLRMKTRDSKTKERRK